MLPARGAISDGEKCAKSSSCRLEWVGKSLIGNSKLDYRACKELVGIRLRRYGHSDARKRVGRETGHSLVKTRLTGRLKYNREC